MSRLCTDLNSPKFAIVTSRCMFANTYFRTVIDQMQANDVYLTIFFFHPDYHFRASEHTHSANQLTLRKYCPTIIIVSKMPTDVRPQCFPAFSASSRHVRSQVGISQLYRSAILQHENWSDTTRQFFPVSKVTLCNPARLVWRQVRMLVSHARSRHNRPTILHAWTNSLSNDTERDKHETSDRPDKNFDNR